MKAYLSIDLDFWNPFTFPKAFLDRLMATGLPVTVVSQHHHLVPHIKQFDFDTLINLDYHSDVADRDSGRKKFSLQIPLECGTWVNHIDGRGKRYIWSYPEPECYYRGRGTCHDTHNPFDAKNPEEVCRWTEVCHRLLWYPRHCDLVAAGIALSKGWAEDRLIERFLEWQKDYPQLPRKRAA